MAFTVFKRREASMESRLSQNECCRIKLWGANGQQS